MMDSMLLGISPENLYFQNKKIIPLSTIHKPYFLAFTQSKERTKTLQQKVKDIWEKNTNESSPLAYISGFGEIETYQSFWNKDQSYNVFKVYTTESYRVPEVSSHLFFYHDLFTAEHDIPYQQRALVDIAAEQKHWLFDSKGKNEQLNILIYDIEMSNFVPDKTNNPIEIIGYADAKISFNSSKDLTTESFEFDITDTSYDINDKEIIQLISPSIDDEIKSLSKFCKIVQNYDIISGHNIVGFDNQQVYGRIKHLLKYYDSQISHSEKDVFEIFLSKQCRTDRSFHFGVGSEVVQIYPCGFDTFLASRKFYPYLESHSLKALAPFLGVGVDDRLILSPSEIKIDERTLRYNRQDVIEQMHVTIHLLQLALPLAFTTCMPFEMLLSAGAVNMWDHMALLRGSYQKKMIPPTCRVHSIAPVLLKNYVNCKTKEDIVSAAKKRKDELPKDFTRVVKYGVEMPDWMQYPYVIHNINASSNDERLNYHMPGGMTIKPDKDAHSHFIPWYHVVVADVGAMYPTILKALNVGADTVHLCKKDETPDMWVWFKKLPQQFFKRYDVLWKPVSEMKEEFADKGYMIGVTIDKKPGVVNSAMTGIMSMISRIKQDLKEVKNSGNDDEINRLKMIYQSVKGARNAGSVDYSQRIILVNPEGKYENIKIGDFVDKTIDKHGYFTEKINGTEFEIANINENWKAISVNKKGIVEIKKVKQVVRHNWKGKLVKISTKSGFTVVTPNHSIFTIKKGEIREISADEVNDNTLLIHANKIPNIEMDQTINLIEKINTTGYYGFINKENLCFFNGLKNELLRLNIKTNSSTPYLKIDLQKLKNMQIPDHLLKHVTIGSNGRKSSRINSRIPIDEKLAELLGYYISEGHTSKRIRNGNPFYYITISNSSINMHERIQALSNEIFGIPVYTLDRMKTAKILVSTIHAKVINHILEEVIRCGINSRNKQIPHQILSSSNSVKNSFFKAYMQGDGNYKNEMPNSYPLGRYITNSRLLNEDLLTLQKQFGNKTNTYFRNSDETYNTRIVNFFKGEKKVLEDCYAIPPKNIEFIDPTSDYVYDISVEDNNNFIDANGGILLHNTHGILAAPNVSGRQFNVWGACAITTKGQVILNDTLQMLQNKDIRVTYGDTDGIYLGCSNSISKLPDFSKAVGFESIHNTDGKWLTHPKDAIAAINECNEKWQRELDYPDFELEPEVHDAMVFVKHKNYLIFDEKNGKVEIIAKGNNFKGSDKANIARKALKDIMIRVLHDIPSWDSEDEARSIVQESIQKHTQDVISNLDFSKVELKDLILIQSVKPSKRYKKNQDGSLSTFGRRSNALEQVIKEEITSSRKFRFVVTKKSLPGITNPSKSGVKPIDFMYPVDHIESVDDIDLLWYQQMIENYIKGAFGLSNIQKTEQTGLDDWM